MSHASIIHLFCSLSLCLPNRGQSRFKPSIDTNTSKIDKVLDWTLQSSHIQTMDARFSTVSGPLALTVHGTPVRAVGHNGAARTRTISTSYTRRKNAPLQRYTKRCTINNNIIGIYLAGGPDVCPGVPLCDPRWLSSWQVPWLC